MKAIRRSKGNLQTAVYTYRKGTQEFHAVGVVHVAEPRFWEDVRATVLAAEQAGCEVHYEYIRNDTGKVAVRTRVHPFDALAEQLGLESQFSGFPINAAWHNTDMTVTEMIDAAPDRAAMEAWLNKTTKQLDIAAMTPRMWMLMRWVVRHIDWIPGGLFMPDEIGQVVQDGRTDYAMRKMLALNRSIITVWGAAHIGRMREWLDTNGFVLTNTQYLTAVTK